MNSAPFEVCLLAVTKNKIINARNVVQSLLIVTIDMTMDGYYIVNKRKMIYVAKKT